MVQFEARRALLRGRNAQYEFGHHQVHPLEHLRRNLGLAGYEVCGPTTARVSLDNLGLQLEIVERSSQARCTLLKAM